MNPLPITMTVRFEPDETPASFCSRNALLVGRSARDFCLDAGFTFQDIVDGKPEAIETLAFRCRAPSDELLATATRKVGERRYMIGDQALTRDCLSRSKLRVCAHCIARDVETGHGVQATRPFGRLRWMIEPIRTCPDHGVALVAISRDEHSRRVHDFATLVQPALSDLDRLVLDAAPRRTSAMEIHLAERLGHVDSGQAPWLSTLPFHAAAKTCETVGAVVTHGIRFAREALSDADWHEAGAVGFEIASTGEAGIRAMLTHLQENAPPRKGDWGPRSYFGRLYEWLAHESEDDAYDPLRDIIRRHFIETLPVGRGDEIFGRKIEFRRLHSVHSASLETGAHPKRLRKLLHATGFISTEMLSLTNDAIVFDAEGARDFLDSVTGAMSLKQAGEYLNAPRPHERLLFEAGHIQPFVAGGTEVLKDHAFSKRDLDIFLRRLQADATALQPGENDLAPIPAAAKRAACGAMKVVELILDRKLRRIRFHPDVPGYLSVMVDPEEVKGLLFARREGSVSLREVEKRLGSTTNVVIALIEQGHLTASNVVNPVTRMKQRVVSEDELARFLDRYVTLHTLAKETGIYFRKLSDLFKERGLAPVFDPKTVSASFYDRVAAGACLSNEPSGKS